MIAMTSRKKVISVPQESAPRAPARPQHSTGMTQDKRIAQGPARSATGAESGYQERTGGTDLSSTSHPRHLVQYNCPGCGGKPGKGIRSSLAGPAKGALREFVREKSQQFLRSLGIFHSSNPADVPLEQMFICETCRRDFYRDGKAQNPGYSQVDTQVSYTHLTIPRMRVQNKNCVFGHSSDLLHRMPLEVRTGVLIRHRLFIPSGARCCAKHLKEGEWTQLTDELSAYSPAQIEEMVDLLREVPPFLQFEFLETMSDKDMMEWTGLPKRQFQDLFSSVPSLLIQEKRHPKTALGLLLAKLRTGETDARLASLAGFSRSQFELLVERARTALTDEMVPQ